MPKPRATARARNQPQRPGDRWVTGLSDAADYAKLPVRTLRDWIAKGLLPAYRIGPRQIQINLDDIDALRVRIPTANGPGRPGAPLALSREDIRALAEEVAGLRAEDDGEGAAGAGP
jgi:excisionase family DNA binding protein